MNLLEKLKGKKSKQNDLSDLGRDLPGLPVRLNDDSARSRRQALGLLVKGAAFMAAWPFISREVRASRLKELVGDSAPEAGSLTAREAARIIGREVLHTNVPHKNIAHQNIAHTNTSTGGKHTDQNKHTDVSQPEVGHVNFTMHTNYTTPGEHTDRPHQDTPHTNEPHTNVEHVNRPSQDQE